MEKLLSAGQVADGLCIHIKTLYRLLRQNKIALPFVRIHGRMIAFRPSDVQTFLETHTVNPNGAGLKKTRKPVGLKPSAELEARRAQKVYPGFMSDEEAQKFFQGCVRDENGFLVGSEE